MARQLNKIFQLYLHRKVAYSYNEKVRINLRVTMKSEDTSIGNYLKPRVNALLL